MSGNLDQANTVIEKSLRRDLRRYQQHLFTLRHMLRVVDDFTPESRAKTESAVAECERIETYLIYALSNLPDDGMARAFRLQNHSQDLLLLRHESAEKAA